MTPVSLAQIVAKLVPDTPSLTLRTNAPNSDFCGGRGDTRGVLEWLVRCGEYGGDPQ